MVIITLIGEHQAKEGEEFVYRGPLTDCRECRLKAVCFNLDPGRAYRIKGIRDVKHECRIHEDGVRVVEVEKIAVQCAVASKFAIESSMITFGESKCENISCPQYKLCHPLGILKNSKWRVASIHGDIECPDKTKMIKVDLE
ncbi:MAG TPA: UPF0179 family protein [Methanomassiliicoccales archaeon]|nr:UPF0179 family protein [Methanomassiliicoccales archaeon]